jgi:hypothetical protein
VADPDDAARAEEVRALRRRDIPRTECAIRCLVDSQPPMRRQRLRRLAQPDRPTTPPQPPKPRRRKKPFVPAGAPAGGGRRSGRSRLTRRVQPPRAREDGQDLAQSPHPPRSARATPAPAPATATTTTSSSSRAALELRLGALERQLRERAAAQAARRQALRAARQVLVREAGAGAGETETESR